MTSRLLLGAVCAALLGGTSYAADLKSGPQPGDKVEAFDPFNVTGLDAGEVRCLV